MKPILVFGNKPQDIEGYTEAINSDEMYVPHHRLEKDYTMKELQEMGRYDIVPPEELIWLPQSYHNGNLKIHKGLRECKHGTNVGVKKPRKSTTVEKFYYARYEKIVEHLNNNRDKRLNRIRFELTFNRNDISRSRKGQICRDYMIRFDVKLREYNKNLKKFEKLLSRQAELKKVGGKVWCSYEQKLQKMIEVL